MYIWPLTCFLPLSSQEELKQLPSSSVIYSSTWASLLLSMMIFLGDWWLYPYVEAQWWFYPSFSNLVVLPLLFFAWSSRLSLVWMSLDAAGLNKLKRGKEDIFKIRKDQSTPLFSNHSGQSCEASCPWISVPVHSMPMSGWATTEDKSSTDGNRGQIEARR